MGLPRAFERRRDRGRIEEQVGHLPLTLGRQPDQMRILDRAMGRLLDRGDDEIADALPLQVGRLLQDRPRIGRDLGLDSNTLGRIRSASILLSFRGTFSAWTRGPVELGSGLGQQADRQDHRPSRARASASTCSHEIAAEGLA